MPLIWHGLWKGCLGMWHVHENASLAATFWLWGGGLRCPTFRSCAVRVACGTPGPDFSSPLTATKKARCEGEPVVGIYGDTSPSFSGSRAARRHARRIRWTDGTEVTGRGGAIPFGTRAGAHLAALGACSGQAGSRALILFRAGGQSGGRCGKAQGLKPGPFRGALRHPFDAHLASLGACSGQARSRALSKPLVEIPSSHICQQRAEVGHPPTCTSAGVGRLRCALAPKQKLHRSDNHLNYEER